jgi:hypothetical protein
MLWPTRDASADHLLYTAFQVSTWSWKGRNEGAVFLGSIFYLLPERVVPLPSFLSPSQSLDFQQPFLGMICLILMLEKCDNFLVFYRGNAW